MVVRGDVLGPPHGTTTKTLIYKTYRFYRHVVSFFLVIDKISVYSGFTHRPQN